MSDRPYVSFAEVKAKVTIPDAMKVLGIRDQFTEKTGVLSGACPLPQHQHGPRPNNQQFKADAKKGHWLYRCFGDCATHDYGGGDVIGFVKAMTESDDAHVRFWFADHFADRLSLTKAVDKEKATVQEPEQTESNQNDRSCRTPLRCHVTQHREINLTHTACASADLLGAEAGAGLRGSDQDSLPARPPRWKLASAPIRRRGPCSLARDRQERSHAHGAARNRPATVWDAAEIGALSARRSLDKSLSNR